MKKVLAAVIMAGFLASASGVMANEHEAAKATEKKVEAKKDAETKPAAAASKPAAAHEEVKKEEKKEEHKAAH